MELFASTPGFCPTCGSIFPPLDRFGNTICYNCGQSFKSDVFGEQIIEYTIHFNNYDPERVTKTKDERESDPGGPVVERKCSKCGHDKMSYATLQLRSADEGQTVFFTCLKCKLPYSYHSSEQMNVLVYFWNEAWRQPVFGYVPSCVIFRSGSLFM